MCDESILDITRIARCFWKDCFALKTRMEIYRNHDSCLLDNWIFI